MNKFEDSKGMKEAYKKLADDMKKRVEKVDELSGYVRDEITRDDLLMSFHEHIIEAFKESMKHNIKANTVVINENLVKVEPFRVRVLNDRYADMPPMICGLEVKYSQGELPDDYAFAVLERPYTDREELVRETTKQIKRDIKKWVKKHKFYEDVCDLECVYVDDLLNFLGLEVDDGE